MWHQNKRVKMTFKLHYILTSHCIICLWNRHYTIRYRERNRKWIYQTCPATDTVIDNLKPNTPYEFGVRPNKDDRSGVWSKQVIHNTNMGGIDIWQKNVKAFWKWKSKYCLNVNPIALVVSEKDRMTYKVNRPIINKPVVSSVAAWSLTQCLEYWLSSR